MKYITKLMLALQFHGVFLDISKAFDNGWSEALIFNFKTME